MTTILTIIVLIAATTALVSYVRNDHFASSRNDSRDELGRALPPLLRP